MTRSATARLFVAVDPPDEMREQLVSWARATLGAVAGRAGAAAPPRVLDPELLHLTLCFLGNRPIGESDAIGRQLTTLTGDAGELSVGAPVWLPKRRPRALAVELHDDTGRLDELHRSLFAAVNEVCDLPADRRTCGGGRHRRFRPHVTVARMRDGSAHRELALAPTPPLSFTPRELILYRSWLSAAGPSYEPLARAPIG